MKKRFKAGDFVFVRDKHGALQSTKVWATTPKRVIVENWEKPYDERTLYELPICRYVHPDKVQLQSEWAKENEADIIKQ